MENFSRRLGITLNVILAVVCGIWVYIAIRHLAFITAVIALGLLLTWLFVAAMVAASKNAVVQAAFDESGMLLRPDTGIEMSQRRILAALALSGVSMFIAWVTGWLYLPLPDGVSQVFPIAFGGTGLVAGWFWFVFKRQGGSSYLLLTPEGFEFPNLGSLNSGEWDDIAAVTDKLPTEERFWTPMVITMKDGSILAMDSPGSYTPKGIALIELMQFYWRHPEQRNEFTDGRALDRLHAMQPERRPRAKP
ncbi:MULTISPECIES: hypothetical protein [unclassified Mycolicibacterium]|uniref:hypothetical protein n=1 Tax=unclassified Mycolicibacterium TaxID=2636767 RepID=UPI0012DD8B24|nr:MULTISPECIES: hypothetical protein [unclassified Mycolicibacterium]MUL81817.1 hypothetical protein [Mycolicibacterium sp. CBMA 329]MUL87583.1 hypothetical protein [Mycolicibacterium sp. CBMA 331]MUL99553.1 hypothetical protein [Mycolicibacterium sp. CBMA 334]MUM26572.1 hypothetical protein [Mycolicibacterium sp. CBMA 295]MUM37880.1 hypothetical protein [Mycolicibacterium sp. CBMA 247]